MKQRITMISGFALLAGILIFSFYNLGQSLASDSEQFENHDMDHALDDDYEHNEWPIISAPNSLYVEECGSCHMAYPASLLPADSWRKMMQGLEDHFGESAELDESTRKHIDNYLVRGSRSGSYQKLFRNLGESTPMRITELPYFKHEHDEIPARIFATSDKLSAISQCNACHQDAERGRFDEDDIYIPGIGRWDD